MWSVGDKIKWARERRGWTIDKLAHESGVHWEYVRDVEHDRKSPTMAQLTKIADALKHSVDWLIDGKKPEKQTMLWCKDC